MLKLYHRTEDWGRDIRGKKLSATTADGKKKFPQFMVGKKVISTQAVLSHKPHKWGCCAYEGHRVVEVDERHFLQQWKGMWELHFIQAVPVKAGVAGKYNLSVRNDDYIEAEDDRRDNNKSKKKGDSACNDDANSDSSNASPGFIYSYFLQPQHLLVRRQGQRPTSPIFSSSSTSSSTTTTLLQPSMMRMELFHYFRPILLNNPRNHVHLILVMDCIVIDRYLWNRSLQERQQTHKEKRYKMSHRVKRLKRELTTTKDDMQLQKDSIGEDDDDDDEQQSLCSFIDDLTTASTSTTTTITSSISRLDFSTSDR